MKNNLKYRLSALLFLASALTITSCSDWTDVESLQLNTPLHLKSRILSCMLTI